MWRLKGTGLEFCNCDPGCGCNFRGVPSSPEGNCEAFLCHVIEEGSDGDVGLSGTTIAWALWWPGAIHDRGGRGHAYIDCETDHQFASLSRIVQGRAGYEYFEIFNSTFEKPTAVERAAVDVVVDGLNSRFRGRRCGRGRDATAPQPRQRCRERRSHREARRIHLEGGADRPGIDPSRRPPRDLLRRARPPRGLLVVRLVGLAALRRDQRRADERDHFFLPSPE